MSKFKVGDVIVYEGLYTNKGDIGRRQVIYSIVDGDYYTIFSDTGEINKFSLYSNYTSNCMLLSGKTIEYSNGLPLVWEDVV